MPLAMHLFGFLLHRLLRSFARVDDAQVLARDLHVQQRHVRLADGHGQTNPGDHLEQGQAQNEWAGGEVEQVQGRVEELVADAHREEDLLRVVHPDQRRLVRIHELVRLLAHQLGTTNGEEGGQGNHTERQRERTELNNKQVRE